MSSPRRAEFQALVVGGGPAGIAAAACAAECGMQAALLDDNPAPGGQIWRESAAEAEPARWLDRLRTARVELLCGYRIFHQPEAEVLLAEGAEDSLEIRYRKLILATGARERFLPFPGWTLPNVMGAGGLQAMVKSGLPITDKRVVVAGSGPLLLAVAAYLRRHGARIAMICEQASWSSLARFASALLRQPAKLWQGLALRQELSGVHFVAGCWPVAAHGESKLESVLVARGRQIQTIPCDYLACGFHLVPNTELAELLGCRCLNNYVEVDDYQRTSVADVFCAGEPTSIGGLELSLLEGQIAGLAAAGETKAAQRFFPARARSRSFARALERCFALRPELRALPLAETLVCRCEDVAYGSLREHTSWRGAKLLTRCGMGPCQGRVCGPAARFLFDWRLDSVRPPIFPARIASFTAYEPELSLTGGQE
jgi:NADPH-dependent 2,4-dienoyl-CoA reductase/sulfur reductase-like enzyme